MNNHENYVREATKGLRGAVRRNTQAELRSHLHERTWQYLLLGYTQAEAERKALIDIGDVRSIRRSLNQVHTPLPSTFLFAIATLIIGACASATLSDSRAQVTVLSRQSAPCNSYADVMPAGQSIQGHALVHAGGGLASCSGSIALDAEALSLALRSQGVRVEQNAQSLTLYFPNTTAPVQATIVDLLSPQHLKSKSYIELESLLASATRTGLPIALTGWENPELHVGNVQFNLGTKTQPFNSAELYLSYVVKSLLLASDPAQLGPITTSMRDVRWQVPKGVPLSLTTTSVPGKIMTLITPNGDGSFFVDVAPVGRKQEASFFAPRQKLTFVRDVNELFESRSGDPQQGKAVLLELADGLDFAHWYPTVSDYSEKAPERFRIVLPIGKPKARI